MEVIENMLTESEAAQPVEELNLITRVQNCLRRAHICTVGQLVACTEEDLLEIHNFGEHSLNNVLDVLGTMGLGLAPSPAWRVKRGQKRSPMKRGPEGILPACIATVALCLLGAGVVYVILRLLAR